jgi:hypothetical protein
MAIFCNKQTHDWALTPDEKWLLSQPTPNADLTHHSPKSLNHHFAFFDYLDCKAA